ncbi:MAG: MFS transporter [Candidatus Omnitrophica bacterium]|nr:MFS transporter [Candidatus Omnitrophota bacterium]MDD5252603.1 MFS transporter [Candidatus Omnitrophota bacterium]
MKKVTFWILCLEGAVLSFNVAAAAALIPSIAADFALSQFVVGKIIWLYMIPYGLAAFFYGPLVRVFDARKVELSCIFLFSLANFLAGMSQDIATLFVARFIMGLFGASVIPLGLIIIARRLEEANRGRYIGLFFGSTFVASLLGLFLSGIINWRLIFIIPAASGFILWVFMYIFLPSFKEEVGNFRLGYLEALRNKRVVKIFSYIFLISLIYHAVQQWLGVYFSTQLNLSQFYISMLITLTSLSGIFGEIWGGRLADSMGRLKVVNLGIAFMVLSIFSLLIKLPLSLLVLVMIIWGLGWTFNHVGLSTMLTDLPAEFLNEAASLNSGVRFISGGIGVSLGGLIMQKSFTLGFLVFGLGLLILLYLSRLVSNKNIGGVL